MPEPIVTVDDDSLVQALETKYDALKDKLILEGLEKQMGEAMWAEKSEQERQKELMQFKLQQKRLKQQGISSVYYFMY